MLLHSKTNLYHPFECGQFFYVFNRGNNCERIFFYDGDYTYFLRRFDEYMSPHLTVYAYCLLPNLFHFLVRVNDDLSGLHKRNPVSQAFSNFFNAYTRVINKQQGRSGSIFEKQFKHVIVRESTYLTNIAYYIHKDPIYYGLSCRLGEYPWCSYSHILNDRPTRLMREEVLSWFGGMDRFTGFHENDEQCPENSRDFLLGVGRIVGE